MAASVAKILFSAIIVTEVTLTDAAWAGTWSEGPCPKGMGLSGYSTSAPSHNTVDKCKQQCAVAPACAGLSFNAASSTCDVYYTDARWDVLDTMLLCWRKVPGFESNQNLKYYPIDMGGQGRTVENSAAACQRRCASVSGCAHFSFWRDGGCHLQDCGSIPTHHSGVTAGQATMAPMCLHCFKSNQKYFPINMVGQGRTVANSEWQCQARCASVSGCAHFSFWRDGGCHLQNSSSTPVHHSGVIAGPPICQANANTPTLTTTMV